VRENSGSLIVLYEVLVTQIPRQELDKAPMNRGAALGIVHERLAPEQRHLPTIERLAVNRFLSMHHKNSIDNLRN
jgi:hypothetical protein